MPGQPSQKPKIAEEEEQLEDMFTFDDLQAIRRVTDDAELASMIILENRRIIITLRERYEVFSQSRAFEDIESLDSDVVNFCKQLSILEGDLESHHARLQLFLRGLERNEEMVSPTAFHYSYMKWLPDKIGFTVQRHSPIWKHASRRALCQISRGICEGYGRVDREDARYRGRNRA